MSQNDILRQWLIHYLKSKDLIKQEIVSMDEQEDKVIVKFKNKTRIFQLFPELKSDILLENHMTIVTFNTKENYKWLLDKWNKVSSYDDVAVCFINPDSTTEHKWIIYPHTHSKIAEKGSLKQGLDALFNSVQTYSHTRH